MARAERSATLPPPGLRANWQQFTLLVLVNAFVGAMVGLERTVLPLLAERDFGVASRRAALAFIVTFGIVKAITNVVAGRLADHYGRKRILVAGWLFGLPVPLLVIWAPTWDWVVAANVLLGINQGLAWSMTVMMKLDLVGSARRGFALGLNEFAGYLAVAVTALATGAIAQQFGLRPAPFYLGIACAAAGLAVSVVFVRDTMAHMQREHARLVPTDSHSGAISAEESAPRLRELFVSSSWRDPALFSASQAGLVNNLNDGLAWGLLPLFFASAGLSVGHIGLLAFIYPAVWGVAQVGTGAASDPLGRKPLIVGGMLLQGVALWATALLTGFHTWLVLGALLGLGTAMVYPTLLATVSDSAAPGWRSSALGVYRFWRDMGYAVGALLAGVLADALGMRRTILAIGALTICSGLSVAWRMPESAPGRV